MEENQPSLTEKEGKEAEDDLNLTDQGKTGEEKNLKQRLADTEKALERTMLQLENTRKYNEALRQRIENLSSELHSYRSAVHSRVDAECQVDEQVIAEACGEKPFPDWGAASESAQASEGVGESIADSLKAAAQEEVWKQSGFVYDSTSGLYYDYNSGYYYDSARSLYYDPSTTAYFYYDETEQTHKFHSYATPQTTEQAPGTGSHQGMLANGDASQNNTQSSGNGSTNNNAEPSQQAQRNSSGSQGKSSRHKQPREKPKVKDWGPDSQQCMDSLASQLQHLDIQNRRKHALDVSASYPPCIRVVVRASDSVELGTFYLVTCPGGTVGRENDGRHVIPLRDVNVSKTHAEIKYDTDNTCYTIEDLGSQNGTFINDLRISESKEKSTAVPLSHGDILRVGGSEMLLHIHPGTDTCDLCEPGQVLAALRAQQTVFNDHVVLTKAEKQQLARQQQKEIKKKYGLENMAYVDNMAAIKHPDYADKAEVRRRFIGSEHPSHQRSPHVPASVHRPISAENKGHRMLAKMGWKEGSGLGKDNAGRAEPVTVELRPHQSAGLGSTSNVSVSLDNVQSAARMRRLIQTQERYHRLEENAGSPSDTNAAVRTSTAENNAGSDHSQGESGTTASVGSVKSQTASGARKGSKKLEIKWIQGQTQKAT